MNATHLKRTLLALTIVFTLMPARLWAQANIAELGGVTIGGAFGGLSGAADLNEAGTADWDMGWIASLDATYWAHQNVGIRASGSWAQDSIRAAADELDGRGTFNKFYYDGSIVARLPLEAGSGYIIPSISGGAGAVSVHQLDEDTEDIWTKFAGNFGVGLEYRMNNVGIRAEGRDFVYRFDRYGYDKVQHDIAWQGGLTLSF